MKNSFILLSIGLVAASMLAGCKDNTVPPKEDPGEIIDKITLIFNPTDNNSAPVTVIARDDDAAGPDDMKADGPIELDATKSYDLFIQFENTLANGDISNEIQKEGDQHMIFFAFTSDVFSSPAGNGNVDSRDDPMNYLDKDDNGLPIGLQTSWITGLSGSQGTFEIVLKHQPDVKSATSDSQIGSTDVQFTWDISIK